MLTSPIPLALFDDPVAAYNTIAESLPSGQRYQQPFDYTTIENPKSATPRYLEDIFPQATVTDIDGDLDSFGVSQGYIGACGTFASISAYAAIPKSSPYNIEAGIYPLTPSPIGLYLVRIADPANPLGTKWMAIDSRVPCNTPTGGSAFIFLGLEKALLPALLMKAAATARGGCFDTITNSDTLKQSFSWFPSVSVQAQTFAEFKKYLDHGAICLSAMVQQYDGSDAAITPSGVVYGHAHALVDTISVSNAELVRIENPWEGGSDYLSDVSEGSQFWLDHPELRAKLEDAKASAGNYWISWEQAKALTGRTKFEMTLALPHPDFPHADFLTYTFDGTPVMDPARPVPIQQIEKLSGDRIKTITLSEPATIQVDVKWLNGLGTRAADVVFVDSTDKIAARFSERIWYGANGTRFVTLPAGQYRVLPQTSTYNADRGLMQVILLSSTPFG